jgi:ribosome-binding protein aMBF1 (putative translation factor)
MADVRIDDSGFQKAMRAYIVASSKDGATAMNRTMNSLAIIGQQETKKAQEDSITAVQNLWWWPAYVAKILTARKKRQLDIRAGKAKTIKGKARILKRRESGRLYSRAEARKVSAGIIKKRSVSISFLRFFFNKMSRDLRGQTQGLNAPPNNKRFKGFEATVKPATMEDPTVQISVNYKYRKRSA